jgi:penicillin amidase
MIAFLLLAATVQTVTLPGLKEPVEILRDSWGIPHIYAPTEHDLFLAQGYITAKDRLFQIDLWRRVGTGKLAEVLGPAVLERDRIARAVRYRGDWGKEWASYGPRTLSIVTAFTDGINAYIKSLDGRRPPEFEAAGYDPGLWVPEDCVARVAGLLMTRNASREVARAMDIKRFGLEKVRTFLPVSPRIPIEVPNGLDLSDITPDILRSYSEAISTVRFPEGGSNNWVVDGTLSASGKPLLANDPHRPILIPSLRKTVHLVGAGWNVIGAGEPALPGVALGHNDRVAFGFTIVGIDQQDLYVEKLNPADPDQYLYRGSWRPIEVERQTVAVKGQSKPQEVELRYTIHGPVIHEDKARHRAYALRWAGSEPGGAGYLAALSVARARNWNEFLAAMEHYNIPSENMVYADVDGNIGWQPAGLTPIRKNWSGLLPVPGDTGEFEWSGFRKLSELPRVFNPSSHYVATANHNILPEGYKTPLGYEWALPFRAERIHEMMRGRRKFTVADFERMQQDVVSLPARRFQAVLKKWSNRPPEADELVEWNAALEANSRPALLYETWIALLPAELFGKDLGQRVDLETTLRTLETGKHDAVLSRTFARALADLEERFGKDRSQWRWGRSHQAEFRHPLTVPAWHRGPVERPGDAHTVNATSGGSRQTGGASYRQIIDLADWDKSVMTNVPGESGDPRSPHYSDLLDEWAEGRYHPMLFTRAKIEEAAVERIRLIPPARN